MEYIYCLLGTSFVTFNFEDGQLPLSSWSIGPCKLRDADLSTALRTLHGIDESPEYSTVIGVNREANPRGRSKQLGTCGYTLVFIARDNVEKQACEMISIFEFE